MSGTVGEPAVSLSTPTETTSAKLSGQMLDLDEDDDLEVFSKDLTILIHTSPQSPGSMVNHYKDEEDTRDIFITVDNPESHVTAVETYISYRVVVKTTRSEFDSSEYQVRRRYQDFSWLREQLEEAYPTLIIHPLPEKFVMKGMVERFNSDFIETRRRYLHKFLNKISEHPILSCHEDFKLFLSAQELSAHKKQGPGFLSRVGEAVRGVAASVRGVRKRPEEFSAMQEYVDSFSQKISSLDKVAHRIVKEQKEYLEELREYAPTYTLWAGSEEALAQPLKGVASCLDRCYQESEEQVNHISEELLPVLHEYFLCADVLKVVLRRRDLIQSKCEAKTETLATSKTEREREALKEEIDKLEDKVEWANSTLKGDWSRWKTSMRADLKSAFINTAEKNVEYYEKCMAVWESFLLCQRADVNEESKRELTS